MTRRGIFALLAVNPTSELVYKSWKDKDGAPGFGIGVTDGKNIMFNLSFTPDPARTAVYLNGLHQRLGSDYVLSGRTLQFTRPPMLGDTIDVDAVGRFTV